MSKPRRKASKQQNIQSNDLYSLVRFDEENCKLFECIPDIWFANEDRTACYWPPIGKSFRLRALNKEKPDSTYTICKCIVVCGDFATYNEGFHAAKEKISEYNTSSADDHLEALKFRRQHPALATSMTDNFEHLFTETIPQKRKHSDVERTSVEKKQRKTNETQQNKNPKNKIAEMAPLKEARMGTDFERPSVDPQSIGDLPQSQSVPGLSGSSEHFSRRSRDSYNGSSNPSDSRRSVSRNSEHFHRRSRDSSSGFRRSGHDSEHEKQRLSRNLSRVRSRSRSLNLPKENCGSRRSSRSSDRSNRRSRHSSCNSSNPSRGSRRSNFDSDNPGRRFRHSSRGSRHSSGNSDHSNRRSRHSSNGSRYSSGNSGHSNRRSESSDSNNPSRGSRRSSRNSDNSNRRYRHFSGGYSTACTQSRHHLRSRSPRKRTEQAPFDHTTSRTQKKPHSSSNLNQTMHSQPDDGLDRRLTRMEVTINKIFVMVGDIIKHSNKELSSRNRDRPNAAAVDKRLPNRFTPPELPIHNVKGLAVFAKMLKRKEVYSFMLEQEKDYCAPRSKSTDNVVMIAYLKRFITLKLRCKVALKDAKGKKDLTLFSDFHRVYNFIIDVMKSGYDAYGKRIKSNDVHNILRTVWGRSNQMLQEEIRKKNK